jgi:hypothetical protein
MKSGSLAGFDSIKSEKNRKRARSNRFMNSSELLCFHFT